MPSNFNADKYKKIFEQRYGAGSFDAGISDARKTGYSKAQAEFEKQDYLRRIREMQQAQQDAIEQYSQAQGLAEQYQQFQQEKQQGQAQPSPVDQYMLDQMPVMGPYKNPIENAKAVQKNLNAKTGLLKDSLSPKSPWDPLNPNYLARMTFSGR